MSVTLVLGTTYPYPWPNPDQSCSTTLMEMKSNDLRLHTVPHTEQITAA